MTDPFQFVPATLIRTKVVDPSPEFKMAPDTPPEDFALPSTKKKELKQQKVAKRTNTPAANGKWDKEYLPTNGIQAKVLMSWMASLRPEYRNIGVVKLVKSTCEPSKGKKYGGLNYTMDTDSKWCFMLGREHKSFKVKPDIKYKGLYPRCWDKECDTDTLNPQFYPWRSTEERDLFFPTRQAKPSISVGNKRKAAFLCKEPKLVEDKEDETELDQPEHLYVVFDGVTDELYDNLCATMTGCGNGVAREIEYANNLFLMQFVPFKGNPNEVDLKSKPFAAFLKKNKGIKAIHNGKSTTKDVLEFLNGRMQERGRKKQKRTKSNQEVESTEIDESKALFRTYRDLLQRYNVIPQSVEVQPEGISLPHKQDNLYAVLYYHFHCLDSEKNNRTLEFDSTDGRGGKFWKCINGKWRSMTAQQVQKEMHKYLQEKNNPFERMEKINAVLGQANDNEIIGFFGLDKCRERLGKAFGISGAMTILKTLCTYEGEGLFSEDFDLVADILPTQNGFIHLKTSEFTQTISPSKKLSRCTPIVYPARDMLQDDPDFKQNDPASVMKEIKRRCVQCPNFFKFLNTITLGYPLFMLYLIIVMGFFITGEIDRFLIYLVGKGKTVTTSTNSVGNNGKSIFAMLVKCLLGPDLSMRYRDCKIFEEATSQSADHHNRAITSGRHARLSILPEKGKNKWDAETFKEVIGEPDASGSRPYDDRISVWQRVTK